MNSYDHYKNMQEDEASNFDYNWGQVSKQLGLKSKAANNRLAYGGDGNDSDMYSNHSRGAIGYDDQRRGAYVDPNMRAINAPVAMGRGNPQVDI